MYVFLFSQYGGGVCAFVCILYYSILRRFYLTYLPLSVYTRILFSAILGGLAVTAKGTIFALRFGKKQFAEYKPRLEPVLADVVLLSEIATLAEQADKVDEATMEEDEEPGSSWDPSWDLMAKAKMKQNLNEFLWSPSLDRQNSQLSNTSKTDLVEGTSNDDTEKSDNQPASKPAATTSYPRELRRSESGRLKVKDRLDPWEVPDDKGDKAAVINIHDILKFRRALTHLDEDCMFGEAFGLTNTRDQCIASSHSVYYRLLKLAPTADEDSDKPPDVLPFDVLALLCLEDDGVTENLSKKRKLRKLFTPDASGGLPLLAFIQAVDKSYKQLVFLRASLKNSYLLDGVLERLANGSFYFLLVLFLLNVMEMNPWALMVSFTSILVSISFALGSSLSRYVEGVLLIAVRRPYDLGE